MRQKKELLKDQLRGAGLKATPSRVAILDLLYAFDKPMDVQQILDALSSTSEKPDQATVYRILGSLVRARLLHEICLKKGTASYEAADKPHHHHLVCEKCGLVEAVTACCEEPRLALTSFQQVTRHNLEFSGICNRCAR